MPNHQLLDIDPDKLFVECSIKEIQDTDKKIQTEIEKKRQELRYMVGERYRDVLTAADTIQSMRNSSETLKAHIHKINDKCYDIQSSTREEKPQPVPVDKLKDFYRSVAIQIKILILIPEIIWTCLDETDYLKAVQIYLLAIHIHTGLELDTEHKVLEKFPLLARLKLSISLFRIRILEGIKRTLKEVKLTPQETSCHLCAYILLESKTQESALRSFIELRQSSLLTLLNSEVTLHSAVRSRVLNLINCLMCTIDLLYSCFIGGENNSDDLVKTKLENILSRNGKSIIKLLEPEQTPLLEYIPGIVTEFRPSCKEYGVLLSPEIVQKVVENWLALTCSTLNSNLSKSLDHVTSVKVLHNIREEAAKIDPPANWDQICLETYLPKDFNLWIHFFQPLISKRAEELVCRRIQTNLNGIFEKISKDLGLWKASEDDLRWFVWTESSEDIGKDAKSHEGLSMKTKGFSPKIVELCHALDKTYFELLQDVSLYLYGNANSVIQVSNSEDGKRLEFYLREESSTSIDKLILHVEKCINKTNNKSVLVGARLFEAISHLCPNLKRCCCGHENEQQWDRVLDKLNKHGLKFWDLWLHATKKHIEDLANNYLLQDITLSNILHVLPKWDVIEIEEQTDDKIINSEIRLPTQPSVSLVTLLSTVLSDLNSIVPHTIPKTVHDRLIDTLVDIVFQHYFALSVHEDVNQSLAIQFLLDVKFLTMICVRRDCKTLMTRSQEISENLRGKVDPFDLDVFYPYLQNCIKRAVLQMQVLFGCLLGSSNQLANIGVLEQSSVCTGDREPTVLSYSIPLNDVWFPLLPVTAPTVKSLTTAPLVKPAEHRPPSSQPGPRNTSPAPTTFVRSGAAALLADWFS